MPFLKKNEVRQFTIVSDLQIPEIMKILQASLNVLFTWRS